MTLTYIFHSSFVLETEQSILIFDYWLDPYDVVYSFLKKNKPIYVFSSHFHEDHFNKVLQDACNLLCLGSLHNGYETSLSPVSLHV